MTESAVSQCLRLLRLHNKIEFYHPFSIKANLTLLSEIKFVCKNNKKSSDPPPYFSEISTTPVTLNGSNLQ